MGRVRTVVAIASAVVAVALVLRATTLHAHPRRDAVIVVSPHPDDESIVAGGMIHSSAADPQTLLWAIYMSGGDAATVPGDCNGIPEARKTRLIVRLREKETRRAWRVLAPGRHVPIRFLRGPDTKLVASSAFVDGVRADVFSTEGERAIDRAVRLIGRLPRSVRKLTLISASRYDAHGDHRAAYEAARRGGAVLRARRPDVDVLLYTFIIHDEWVQNVPICCIEDRTWPVAGPVHDYLLLTDTPLRPRPPRWPVTVDVSDLVAVRRDALAAHVSQVQGYAPLCMPVFVPDFYDRWSEKTEEPFYVDMP